jgi:Winged helix DNA-binding domain
MTFTDILKIRLINQQIHARKFKSVKDIVNWMGAMQAQDFSMSKWAIGTRLHNSTEKIIEAAFDKGEILRTHLLRPTLHLVSADDIHWILKLTAPRIISFLKSRYKQLELSESLFGKSNIIIEDALKVGIHLTRDELIAILGKSKIVTVGQRGYHILVRAELDGIVCSGKVKDKIQTYALLNERVPGSYDLGKDYALEKIARKYFSSRGPAALQDFKWWSGLSVTDARNAFEMIKPDLVSVKVGAETYWMFDNLHIPGNKKYSADLLPAFDEFIISYKDRSASLPSINFKKAVSENGIFRPVIVINGQVIGLWKRTIKKEKVIIETDLFDTDHNSFMSQIEEAIKTYGLFLGKETVIKQIIT